ncbi:putative fatty acid synthesis protein [Clostridioides difficile DA00165]|nr:putative fatty acid synthesis protein [Clostridioides difficile DA00165]
MPDKEIVTRQIAGVDIMDLEDAAELWTESMLKVVWVVQVQ